MKYPEYLDSSTEAMLGSIFTIEYWIVTSTEYDADLRIYIVVTIIQCCGRLPFSAVDVLCREGIHWSINGSGIMVMGWNFFVFLNTFFFRSLAFVFQKSPKSSRSHSCVRSTTVPSEGEVVQSLWKNRSSYRRLPCREKV